MPVYKTIAGFVQFDPNERELPSKQKVRDVVIRPIASGDAPNVRITVWPEHGAVALEKGHFVVAQGKFTESSVGGKTYYNLSASDLVVLTPVAKSTDEVENPVADEEDASFDPGF